MIKKIRKKLLAFIYADKDVPILAGFSVGFYVMLFYYSKNFSLANSLEQLLFFTAFYILLPIVTLFIGFHVLRYLKLARYQKNFLLVGMISFLSYYLLQMNTIGVSKKITFLVVLVLTVLASIWLKKYYKFLILALFFMSLFNVKPIAGFFYKAILANDEWKQQPDDITNIRFKHKPNIYYIQPDGYTSFSNLRDSLHNFDNRDYEVFLKEHGFTLYNDYRSNYVSTLLSNSATFSMKHHYIAKQVESYQARKIIMSDNAVLRVLKNNGYKTFFITQSPYLLMNRPELGYDYANISYNEIPYLKDGLGMSKDVTVDLKEQMIKNGKSGNFYFVEKFSPGHIHTYISDSEGVEKEKDNYIGSLQKANIWLKEIIKHVEENDPDGIIIIGADHGGFAGFKNTLESLYKTDNKRLIHSIYGAHLAIKWNSTLSKGYDSKLTSGVNLFRTVFSFLAEDKRYLEHLQENSSYIRLHEPSGRYKYIDDKGKVVFEEL